MLLCIYEIVIGRFMVFFYVCVEHLCTLYTYLICRYWAIIYKDMGIVVFVVGH